MNDIMTNKQTPIGVIPNDWEVKKLKDLTLLITKGTTPNSFVEKGIKFIKTECFTDDSIDESKCLFIEEQVHNTFLSRSILKEKDILFAIAGSIGKCNVVSNEILPANTNQALSIIRLKNKNSVYYILQLLKSDFIHQYIYSNVSAGAQPNLNLEQIGNFSLPFPPLPEQQKIAEVLNVWDNGVTKIKAIITELKQRKNGLAMELLSGRLRLSEKKQNSKLIKNKGFTIPNDWKVASLSKVVKQVKNSVTPEDDKLYKQIGIRSHAKGIFYKEEVTGLSLGNKSVFQIEPDCFIVNIVFAWEHAIAKTTINEVGMIASHRFPMYKPVKDELDLDYLLHFFKSKKGKELLGLASPGGAGRNKTLGQSEFLKLQVPIPDITEQRRIAEMLDKVDAEILLYQEKLAAFQLQKKGLMQQLLTGKVRTIIKM